MTIKNEEVFAKGRAEKPLATRKPYQKPVFRYERVFETMALNCGKINPTQRGCAIVRKS
jgi:hypothetical protein